MPCWLSRFSTRSKTVSAMNLSVLTQSSIVADPLGPIFARSSETHTGPLAAKRALSASSRDGPPDDTRGHKTQRQRENQRMGKSTMAERGAVGGRRKDVEVRDYRQNYCQRPIRPRHGTACAEIGDTQACDRMRVVCGHYTAGSCVEATVLDILGPQNLVRVDRGDTHEIRDTGEKPLPTVRVA